MNILKWERKKKDKVNGKWKLNVKEFWNKSKRNEN